MTAPADADRTPTVGGAPALPRMGWWVRQRMLVRRPRFETGWATLAGPSHPVNQDAVLAAPPFVAVADGVGGGKAGELASSAMLAWCRSIAPAIWRDPQRLAAQLIEADAALSLRLAPLNTGGPSATTFAGAWLMSGWGWGPAAVAHVAHVGDVRVLRFDLESGGIQVAQVTVDQTYIAMGEEPPPGGSPEDPARMVGVGVAGRPPVQRIALRVGGGLLICSDGFHRFVPVQAMVAALQQDDEPLSIMAARLAQAAVWAGSRDDVSVLLLRLNPRAGVRRPFWWALAATVLAGLTVALAQAWQPSAPAEGLTVPVGTAETTRWDAAAAGSGDALAPAASASALAREPGVQR